MHRFAIPIATLLTLTTTTLAQQIESPLYAAWAKQPTGTTATFRHLMPTATPGQTLEQEVTQKLTAVKPDAVTLEVTTRTQVAPGNWLSGAAQPKTLPAKIEKGREYLELGGDFNVAITDLKEGKETLDINGTKVETTTREFTATVVNAQGRAIRGGRGQRTIKARLWLAPNLPGGLAKSEQTTIMPGMPETTTSITLTAYTIAK